MIKKKKSSQNSIATKKDIKKLEKQVNNLEDQVKITKVEVRKFSTKLDGVRNQTWLDMDSFKHEIKDEMSLQRNDMAEMKDEIKRITSLEQPKFT